MKKLKLFSAVFIAMALMSSAVYAQYTTIYAENMGSSTTTVTAIEDNIFQDLTVSYSGSNAVIRTTSPSATGSATYYPTASGDNNLFLAKDSVSEFIISGISTEHFKNIEFSFGWRKNANAVLLNDITIEYSTDNVTWSPIKIGRAHV